MPHGNPVDGAQTWGIDGVRSYPRLQRHHIGLYPRLRGANSYLSQEEKIEGFDGVAPGRNLEFLPTVTATRTDERPPGADGPLEQARSTGAFGLTARWGITPNVTAAMLDRRDRMFSGIEFPQWTARANLQTRPHSDVLFTTRFERVAAVAGRAPGSFPACRNAPAAATLGNRVTPVAGRSSDRAAPHAAPKRKRP